MKNILLPALLVIFACKGYGQSTKDSTDIRTTVLNYVEGWYEGNGERMADALHPKIAKRIIGLSGDFYKDENILDEMNFMQLVDRTKNGIGKQTPKKMQMKNIAILSIDKNIASVKTEMNDRYELMHLGCWNGKWKIINVLSEMKPQK